MNLFLECQVDANPRAQEVSWYHNVSTFVFVYTINFTRVVENFVGNI